MRAVFLHGFGADCLSWLGNMGALPEVEKITPDLKGHGNASGGVDDGSIQELGEGVMAEIGDGPPAWLFGHSLGGGVAIWLAAHYPERWKGLCLMAPLGLGHRVDLERLKQYPDITDEDDMLRFLEGLVFDKSIIKREFATYALSQLDQPGRRDDLGKIVRSIPQSAETVEGLLEKASQAGLDTTVFWGCEDDVVRPQPEVISAVGALVELPRVGHIVHVEAMKEINLRIRQKLGLG